MRPSLAASVVAPLAMLLVAPALARAAAPADAPDPDAPTVGASVDHTEVHVGDRITLTVSAVAKAGVAVTLPSAIELGKLEILDRSDGEHGGRDLGNGKRSYRFVLGIAAYEVGDVEVPALELSYITPQGVKSASTEPIPVHVRSLLGPGEGGELQPNRQARAAIVEDRRAMTAMKWAGITLLGLVALAVLWRLTRRVRRHVRPLVEAPLEPPRPPEQVAMEKLRALRAAGHFEVGGYRPFFFAVAEVVREYLGARYKFDSLELTTTELLDALAMHAPHLIEEAGTVIGPGTGEVGRFLAATDLVKFANAGSSAAGAEEILKAAEAIVLSTAAPLETVARGVSGPVRMPRDGTNG